MKSWASLCASGGDLRNTLCDSRMRDVLWDSRTRSRKALVQLTIVTERRICYQNCKVHDWLYTDDEDVNTTYV
ncbi:uncharacterized protein G2W53_010269 [Senna tora]|uniref:Uncharacterized protein n=1 Tax=Senna tora TaxID=362788 RepID=A0A835CBC3_9FABA|nr:uncharacterized protein G2W53_010269 [Senna tora]